ncbi:MAG: hypothetical protein AB7I38_12515 [Dehalococcoidia bacterium]
MSRRQPPPRLLSGILVLVAISTAAAFIAGPRADATATYGPLITQALKYDGTRGGECYMFMQKVVKEVTGRLISGDYRQSYLNAGAVEVPIAQAQSGDIIQLVDDKNTAASANYAGLHTALIMDVHGGGKFKVIDSNYLFDGIVRVHDDYSPQESAARYKNISVHVWRVPEGKVTPTATVNGAKTTATASATPKPAEMPAPRDTKLAPGTTAAIAADGDCLRIRDEAGLAGKEVVCAPTGATVKILEGTEEKDGYRWQLVQFGSVVGWAADMYLQPVSGVLTAASTDTSAQSPAASELDAAATAEEEAEPDAPAAIMSGEAPADAGGYALFVFGGGTYDDLLAAAGCPKETASFWATSGDGQFSWYIPAVTVAAVNAAWDDLFSGEIPTGTPLMGRCA